MLLKSFYYTDVQRIKLYLNNSLVDTSDPESLWNELLELLDGSICELFRIIPYITQVFLTDLYINEIKKLNHDEQLMCDPLHTVYLVIENACEWRVTVKQKMIKIFNHEWNLDTCTIIVNRNSRMSHDMIEIQYDADGLNQTTGSIILDKACLF
jgi:hypothetical protein